MSLNLEPDYSDYIIRLSDILSLSALLLPKTIGGSATEQDLINQIIEFELPLPENPVEGPGPPHIFITTPPNPIKSTEQLGRDSRDAQGPYALDMEYWIVVISSGTDPIDSEKKIYKIISAITTTLQKNKRLTDSLGDNPLAATTTYNVFPYILDTTQRDLIAKNIVLRVKVGINLR